MLTFTPIYRDARLLLARYLYTPLPTEVWVKFIIMKNTDQLKKGIQSQNQEFRRYEQVKKD
ncbi:MAG: hypothetical protein OSB64_07530, partial [Candidatus Marinimicrobia bacterium]|nr:hypothetical protein [Candidatus Neomarinimicrobiota bacterium]